MNLNSRTTHRAATYAGAAALALAVAFFLAPAARTKVTLTEISADPFTVGPGQHATEVEPHAFAFGNTIVAAFQTGRIYDGGGTDIGFSTSTDGGKTWTRGFLPGIVPIEGNGPYLAASDPAVAYDPNHGVWMIASLPIANGQTPAVIVSRSTDGLTWQNPVSVDPTAPSSDKNWIVCDSWSSSPFYGNCYVEWDDPNTGLVHMSTSTDGGMTWGPALDTADNSEGIGGQPLVRPNGNVVVPLIGGSNFGIAAFGSLDGGTSWTKTINIANIDSHTDAGGIRSGPLPSAAVDGGGNLYVVWEDCRFRTNCSTNDLVLTTSKDGRTWTPVARIPIDPVTTNIDHFIPGIGADPTTSGGSAHLAMHFYYYTQSDCTTDTCQLYVGYISSHNGGSTWNKPVSLNGPMNLNWLPQSQNGLMVGDYIATAFNNGVPHGVFELAQANNGSQFHEATFTAQGLTAAEEGPQLSSAGDYPVPNAHGDPIEREKPEKGYPPSKKAARRSAKK
jgi:hypothetical protein